MVFLGFQFSILALLSNLRVFAPLQKSKKLSPALEIFDLTIVVSWCLFLILLVSIFNLLADFQVNERAMILTSDGRLYKLDPTKKFKVMLSVTLSDVTSVTISPDGGNQLVVMHLRPPSNDLVVSMTSSKGDDVIGELVGIFGSKYQKMMGRNLDVQVR